MAEVKKVLDEAEKKLEGQFKRIDEIAFKNQKKVLDAFIELKVSAQ